MIVSKFKTPAEAEAFGQALVEFFDLPSDDDGRYSTDWGTKTLEGLARCVERMYRERVYGKDEELPADAHFYAANPSGEDPVWPKQVDKLTK